MIVVDRALAARQAAARPIRVGVVGAGSMARGVVAQITGSVPGMEVAAICNRTLERAIDVLGTAGARPARLVDSARQLDAAVAAGRTAVTDDPVAIAGADSIDCIVDATGSVEHGARVALAAVDHGTPFVLLNAELDATLGPIVHDLARRAGVLSSCADGDQPGVELNLERYVRGLGLMPRVLGNVKGLHDERRTPATQAAFAATWQQDAHMVTSFADGSKVNVEQCIVANATGFTVPCRGMLRRHHDGHVDELTTHYDLEQLRDLGGIVDYVVGARPAPGVFCLAELTDPRHRRYLEMYKLGPGPLYSFYHPYHLCHLEVPLTVARLELFGDVCGRPLGAPVVEVVAVAKRELRAGEVLDAFGGYLTYGQAEAAAVVQRDRLLPQGLADGCRLRRDVPCDEVIGWDDVVAPEGRLAHRLYAEQVARFAGVSTRAS